MSNRYKKCNTNLNQNIFKKFHLSAQWLIIVAYQRETICFSRPGAEFRHTISTLTIFIFHCLRLEINCFTFIELHVLFSNFHSTSVTLNGCNILLLCISIVKPPFLARCFSRGIFVINETRETQKHRMIAAVSLANRFQCILAAHAATERYCPGGKNVSNSYTVTLVLSLQRRSKLGNRRENRNRD